MAKYLVQWRLNTAMLPYDDPAEYEKLLTQLTSMVEMNLKKGNLIEWGVFLDSVYGFSIQETDGEELMKNFILFEPYVEVLDVNEFLTVDKASKALREGVKTKLEMMKK